MTLERFPQLGPSHGYLRIERRAHRNVERPGFLERARFKTVTVPLSHSDGMLASLFIVGARLERYRTVSAIRSGSSFT